MPVTGPIADSARGNLPVTWDALKADSQLFGETLLQAKVDLAKEQVFGRVILVAEEADYPLRVVDFVGKKVALSLVSPGIDLWMNEYSSVVTTGTDETTSYINRADQLRETGKTLQAQILRDQADIYALLGSARPTRVFPRPAINTPADDVLLTGNPRTMPAPFKTGLNTQRLR